MLILDEAWHPYWSWEHLYFGFFDNDRLGVGVRENERLRKQFFITPGAFQGACIEMCIAWPVCTEHFLTGSKLNPISWLGQAASFYYSGVTSKYSYAYNQLPAEIRKINNGIAKEFIETWRSDRESKIGGGVYQSVEKERLSRGFTPRVPRFFKQSGARTELQGDLFSNFT